MRGRVGKEKALTINWAKGNGKREQREQEHQEKTDKKYGCWKKCLFWFHDKTRAQFLKDLAWAYKHGEELLPFIHCTDLLVKKKRTRDSAGKGKRGSLFFLLDKRKCPLSLPISPPSLSFHIFRHFPPPSLSSPKGKDNAG